MIITRTPFRMSFFGGGTDLPEFFNKYGGAVLSTTFDKYCYVNVRHLPRFFDYKNQITYSKIERVKDVDHIEHPAVREAMRMLDMEELIITYDADLPARTGLGTSSSFAVGMLSAFYSLKGKYASKEKLAQDSIYLERVLCNERGGWQDQIAASYGGFNLIEFRNNSFYVRPIIIEPSRKKELNEKLMLFFTGFSRFSSDIQGETSKNFDKKTKQLLEMKELVYKAENILVDKNINLDEFGKLLHYAWSLKKSTGPTISNDKIDEMYSRAINNGALGGKLLGAGGGGFLLFYVPIEKQENVRKTLSDCLYIPFKFEDSGTEVVYYAPEEYHTNQEEK